MKNYMKLGVAVGLLSAFAGYAAEMSNERALVPVTTAVLDDGDQKRNADISEKERRRLTGLLIETLAGERDKELLSTDPTAPKTHERLEKLILQECQRLIAAKADVDFPGATGSPLIFAGDKWPACSPVIPLLLCAGADDTYLVNNRSFHDYISQWDTPRRIYQTYVQEHIVPLLKATGLPTDCVLLIANKMGMTDQDKNLYDAVYKKNHKQIRNFLKINDKTTMIKADPNVCSGSATIESALRHAWRHKDFESVDLLLSAGANPDKTDFWSSRTILRCMIEETEAERAPYLEQFLPRLLQAGANVNKSIEDYSGRHNVKMPLFVYAIKRIGDDRAFIKLLLEHGKPDLTRVDEKGKTALDYAKDKPETLALLQEYQKNKNMKVTQ